MPPQDLSHYANEAGLWFESRHDRRSRSQREVRVRGLIGPVMDLISDALTEKQRQALILYYFHRKTQEEVAQIMGISRRVVSQHLFGICRHGKQVGGAIQKIRKLCRQRGIERRA